MIDLRSDTVTQPTPAMREAMNSAPLGDDVFGDDPSVNALQEKAAAMFGHEAALFCPSGTMTNQIAIKVHTKPGDEVICDRLAHVYNYEGGGIALNSGCSVKLLSGDAGRFTASDVINAINPDDPHFPVSRLVVIENSSNKGGGAVWKMDEIQAIRSATAAHGLALHLDGARLFNALATTGTSTVEVGQAFDSISICLSKGLGAPVGSLLIGSSAFIKQAIRVRKVFGGGMRQAGILAAAGAFALDHHVERLAEDHSRAQVLASVLEASQQVKAVVPPATNIVIATLHSNVDPKAYLSALEQAGIATVGFGGQNIRFVTHLDFDDQQLDRCMDIIGKLAV